MEFDNLEDSLKYSDLQTKVLTMLEIESYILKQRIELEMEMERLKAAPKGKAGLV